MSVRVVRADSIASTATVPGSVAIPVPPEVIAMIAHAVVAIIADTTTTSASPWMTRAEAAEYLRLPVSRLEKDRRIPCHRDGGRVLYHREEIDSYFLDLGR